MSVKAGGKRPLDWDVSGPGFEGDFGGSSPGSRLRSVVKNSPVRCRSCDCCFACLSSV